MANGKLKGQVDEGFKFIIFHLTNGNLGIQQPFIAGFLSLNLFIHLTLQLPQ